MRTLVICEKFLAAQDVAEALGCADLRGEKRLYLEAGTVRIAWLDGHLLSLAEPEYYNPAWKDRKVFPIIPGGFEFVPVSAAAGRRLEALKKLLAWAELVVNACDAGREGELIFSNFWNYAGLPAKPLRRLWVSNTTPEAVQKAWAKMDDGGLPKYRQMAEAARTRTCADWLLGINASRSVSFLLGGESDWSVGRVQTAVLFLIFHREKIIRDFASRPYYSIYPKFTGWDTYEGKILVPDDFKKLGRLSHIFAVEQEALAVEHLVKMTGLSKWGVTDKPTQSRIYPFALNNLESLQRFFARRFGWSGSRTLKSAQQAYVERSITYPRTDSQYLPPEFLAGLPDLYRKNWANTLLEVPSMGSLDLPDLQAVLGDKMFSPFNAAKVGDHHAIIPTGLIPKDPQSDAYLVWRVVSRNFLLFFSPAARVGKLERMTKLTFPLRSSFLSYRRGDPYSLAAVTRVETMISQGWLDMARVLAYPVPEKLPGDRRLPREEPDGVSLDKTEFYQGFTEPPEPLNEETLLSYMSALGLGTPATQSEVIETLVSREYVTRSSGRPPEFKLTRTGYRLIMEVLQSRLPVLGSPELSARWEKELVLIAEGKVAEGKESTSISFLDGVRGTVQDLAVLCRGGRPSVVCPLTGLPIKEDAGHYIFPGCPRPLPKKLAGRDMMPWEYRDIIVADTPLGPFDFLSKKGNRFEAKLVYKKDVGEISFSF